jgi:hypothetical protein
MFPRSDPEGKYLRGLRMCESYSFAPPGLVPFPLPTHGLRRGLHSDAASRLKSSAELHRNSYEPVLTQSLKPAEMGDQGSLR